MSIILDFVRGGFCQNRIPGPWVHFECSFQIHISRILYKVGLNFLEFESNITFWASRMVILISSNPNEPAASGSGLLLIHKADMKCINPSHSCPRAFGFGAQLRRCWTAYHQEDSRVHRVPRKSQITINSSEGLKLMGTIENRWQLYI